MGLADNPKSSVEYIGEEMREIVGAKTILIFECSNLTGCEEHRLVSVVPERRRALGDNPLVLDLVDFGQGSDRVVYAEPAEPDVPGRLLARLGAGASIIMPLRYAAMRVGVILFLDLMDMANVASILSTFDRLSPILALIMRNAYLYANMESEVDRRTRELEEKNAELETLLREKVILLKEIHHRVKNNLQIINSLLYLRANGIRDAETRELFVESQNRVLAMALAHEELYRSPDLSRINMRDYVARLVDRVLASASLDVETTFDLEAVLLVPDEAIPCGLLLDELLMNAIKHAFSKRGFGKLEVTLRISGEEFELVVADDGPGLDPFLLEGTGGGLGFIIVRGLAEQLHGKISVGSGPGARFKLSFPLAEGKGSR
jgi:two-component sensor histidine kinase